MAAGHKVNELEAITERSLDLHVFLCSLALTPLSSLTREQSQDSSKLQPLNITALSLDAFVWSLSESFKTQREKSWDVAETAT